MDIDKSGGLFTVPTNYHFYIQALYDLFFSQVPHSVVSNWVKVALRTRGVGVEIIEQGLAGCEIIVTSGDTLGRLLLTRFMMARNDSISHST